MKPLIATTALALVFATPAMAQTTGNGDQQTQQATGEQGFLSALEQGDILASELLGQEVYAHSSEQMQDQQAQQDQQTQDDAAQVDETTTDDMAADDTDTAEQSAADDTETVEIEVDTDEQTAADDTAADDTGTAEQTTDDMAADDTGTAEQATDDMAADDTGTAEQTTDDMTADDTGTAEQQVDQTTTAGMSNGEVEHRTIAADQLDAMETIGNVDEVILDQEGQLKAIVVGVGGFLGAGDRNVALTPDHFDLAWDQEENARYYVIADTTVEQLEQAPEFELAATDDQMAEDQQTTDDQQVAQQQTDEQAAQTNQQWRGDRDALMVPEVTREGYQTAEATALSADDVIGSSVYDLNEDNIGNVDDIVLGSNGDTGYIVLDVGGFLGMGTHTVALGLDEVSVLYDEGWGDVRIYVDASQDQLESMEAYEG